MSGIAVLAAALFIYRRKKTTKLTPATK